MTDRESRSLDARAAAFAPILASTDDAESAFRQAATLADGLFPHQAEDRAYRLGQTRTVNVTYVVWVETIDEFVQAVLETKTALVRSGVEREALAGDDGGKNALASGKAPPAGYTPVS